jgi:hypothetical protein
MLDDIVPVNDGPMCRRHPGRVLEILHEQRHACHQARIGTTRDLAIDLLRSAPGAIHVEVANRVESGRIDRVERSLERI